MTSRMERDSNPRYSYQYFGFQDRLFQPLRHPSPSVTYFDSYLRYTSIQDKHRKGYSTKTGLSPYLSRLTLSYTEVIFSSISFRFCVYRYRPIISQLPILYSIDEGEYLSSSFQHLRLTSSRWT